jgi:hypothetical protein
MNPGPEPTEHFSASSGRHRRGSAGTWTPRISDETEPAGRRHGRNEPVDLPARGLLPVMVPAEHADPVYPPAQGELPVPRRARITLNSPERPTTHDDDVRVYTLPPDTGLATFDLGSVPASVTPPRTWRKAAWFATASSGGVVLALLFAGSALVGKAPTDQAGGGWVPGLGGGQPAVGGEQPDAVPGKPGAGEGHTVEKITGSLPADTLASSPASVRQPASASVSTDTPRSTESSVEAPAPAQSSPVPPKPVWAAAPYEADPLRVALPEGSPGQFAEDSQRFLAAVTENPAAAHSMTAGDLRRRGAGELARRYGRVAYFVVKYVKVHQYEGRTVCTVRTVYKDGTQVIEQRVLTFSRGKINSDG